MDVKRARSRYIYRFGRAQAEGDGAMTEELGGKGASLAEMTRLGLPVPAGFTISTRACRFYLEHGAMPPSLEEELESALLWLEREQAQRLGGEKDPLLLSVRSGASISMPGMMDTILNVGINDAILEGLAAKHQNITFALDSYRRLLQMFGSVVLQIPKHAFDQAVGRTLAMAARKPISNRRSLPSNSLSSTFRQTIPHGSTRSIAASGGSRIRVLEQ